MKRALLLTLISTTLTLTRQDAKAQTAFDHMQLIASQSHAIQKDFWDYSSSVAHGKSARKVEARRQELIQTVKISKSKVRGTSFKEDNSLRDTVVDYLQLTFLVLNDDYGKILDMEAIAEQSYDAMEMYLAAQDSANAKLKEAGERLLATERKFAATHGITLVEDNSNLSKKIEKANEVFAYYKPIYLIFFRSYKQEAYLLDAMQRKDVSGIEQNRTALAATAEEGLKKLEAIPAYNSDPNLKNACRQMLEFYIDETEDLEKVTGFYLKEEEFNKAKKALDAKGKQRTKNDVDSYNNAVNEMNSALEDYNSVIGSMDKNRGVLLTTWNKSTSGFLDKHTPRHR